MPGEGGSPRQVHRPLSRLSSRSPGAEGLPLQSALTFFVMSGENFGKEPALSGPVLSSFPVRFMADSERGPRCHASESLSPFWFQLVHV